MEVEAHGNMFQESARARALRTAEGSRTGLCQVCARIVPKSGGIPVPSGPSVSLGVPESSSVRSETRPVVTIKS